MTLFVSFSVSACAFVQMASEALELRKAKAKLAERNEALKKRLLGLFDVELERKKLEENVHELASKHEEV